MKVWREEEKKKEGKELELGEEGGKGKREKGKGTDLGVGFDGFLADFPGGGDGRSR